jgi:hypothetical protein
MSGGDQQNSHNRRNNDTAYWTFFGLRKLKELEARNLVLDIPEPDFYFSDATKKRLFVALVFVVVAAAVVVGVVVGSTTTSQKDPSTSPSTPISLPTVAPSVLEELTDSLSSRDRRETSVPSLLVDPTNSPSVRDSPTITPTVGTVPTMLPTVSTLPTDRLPPFPGVVLSLEYMTAPEVEWAAFATPMGLHNGLFLSPGDKYCIVFRWIVRSLPWTRKQALRRGKAPRQRRLKALARTLVHLVWFLLQIMSHLRSLNRVPRT